MISTLVSLHGKHLTGQGANPGILDALNVNNDTIRITRQLALKERFLADDTITEKNSD